MATNRIMSVEELSQGELKTLYNELEKTWGTTLANTALGVPSMEIVFADRLDSMHQLEDQLPGLQQPGGDGMCALCLTSMEPDDLPDKNAPFGICDDCKRNFESYLKGEE